MFTLIAHATVWTLLVPFEERAKDWSGQADRTALRQNCEKSFHKGNLFN